MPLVFRLGIAESTGAVKQVAHSLGLHLVFRERSWSIDATPLLHPSLTSSGTCFILHSAWPGKMAILFQPVGHDSGVIGSVLHLLLLTGFRRPTAGASLPVVRQERVHSQDKKLVHFERVEGI